MSCSPSSVRTKNKASGLDKKLAGNIDLRSLTVVRVERLLKKARFLFFDVNIGFKFNLARVLNLLCHVSWIHVGMISAQLPTLIMNVYNYYTFIL